MKNAICLFIGLMLLSMASPTQAQTRFGIKAGLNLASNSVSDLSSNGTLLQKDSYNGFLIGPTMEVMAPLGHWGLDLSVLYSQKGVSFKDFGKATVSYIDIPLNLKYKYGIPRLASLYATAGPYVSYGFPGKLTDHISAIDINKLDVGGNVGLGIEFLRFQVGANYGFGFSKNVLEIQQEGLPISEINYKNGLWSITATYFLKY